MVKSLGCPQLEKISQARSIKVEAMVPPQFAEVFLADPKDVHCAVIELSIVCKSWSILANYG
jgi:hypothetical protein